MSDSVTWRVVVGLLSFVALVVIVVVGWYNYMVYRQRKESANWEVERRDRLEAWKKWKEAQKSKHPEQTEGDTDARKT